MSHTSGQSGTSGGGPWPRYFLKPTASRHEEQSRQMILRAAAAVEPGDAIVLGGGACSEIPLNELAATFHRLTLNDIEREPLDGPVARLDPAVRDKVDLRIADLTGVVEAVLDKLSEVVGESADADDAVARMAGVVAGQPASGMQIGGRYDLVIASCLLSQLDFWIIHRSEEVLARRFPNDRERLREAPAWLAALQDLNRRLQTRFVHDLVGLVADSGRIYLSESVQMCFIELAPDGRWQTEGTWRMLESKDLRTYVPEALEIVEEGRWEWIVWPPQKPGDRGRLFDVQALVLAANP